MSLKNEMRELLSDNDDLWVKPLTTRIKQILADELQALAAQRPGALTKFVRQNWNGIIDGLASEAERAAGQLKKQRVSGPDIPSTVNDWQLYDEEGAAKAAKELATASKKAAEDLRKELADVYRGDIEAAAKVIGQVYKQHLYPVMKKHVNLGALDTEPRGVAHQFLIDVAKHVLGISPNEYHPELGNYM